MSMIKPLQVLRVGRTRGAVELSIEGFDQFLNAIGLDADGDANNPILQATSDLFLSYMKDSVRAWFLVDAGTPMGRIMAGQEVPDDQEVRDCHWIQQHKLVKVGISAYAATVWSLLPQAGKTRWASFLVEVTNALDFTRMVSVLWTWGFALLYPNQSADLALFSRTVGAIPGDTDALDVAVLGFCHTEVFTGDDFESLVIKSMLQDAEARTRNAVANFNEGQKVSGTFW